MSEFQCSFLPDIKTEREFAYGPNEFVVNHTIKVNKVQLFKNYIVVNFLS